MRLFVLFFGLLVATPAVADAGRFQIVISPHHRDDTFMIDTETGKVWQFTWNEDRSWIFTKRIDDSSALLRDMERK